MPRIDVPDDRPDVPTVPAPGTRAIQVDPARALGLLAAVVLVIGSLGPWGGLGAFTVNGTEGDGVVTAAGGALALVLIALDRATWCVLLIGVGTAGITAVDWSDITSREVFGAQLQVGWGLMAAFGAAVGLIVWAAHDLASMRRARA